jgi:NADPH:quinone reductase
LEPVTLDFFELIPHTPLTIRHVPHWVSPTTDGRDIATLVRLTTEGRLHPEIGHIAEWSDTAKALDDVYERRTQGNAVLTIASNS